MPKDGKKTSELRFDPRKAGLEKTEGVSERKTVAIQTPGAPFLPLPVLTVQEGKHHFAKMLGALPDNAGHRVTGPTTQAVYDFIGDKYLHYYANFDGILRYYYLCAESNNKKILSKFIEQFIAIVKDNGELTNMSPKAWEHGKARPLFLLINSLNRRRDDVNCPINDLNIVKILNNRSHTKFPDACLYLRHHDTGGIFAGLYTQFQALVLLLAKDIREYDTKINLNSGGFGYNIRKEAYVDVKDFILAKSDNSSPIARIVDQELVYDENAFAAKIRKENKELVYLENLRILYFKNPAIACQFEFGTVNDTIVEKNYHQMTYHGYQKIAGGFVATPNGEPETMELIKTNMSTLECHMRPKFGRFFLSYKRLDNEFSYQVVLTCESTLKTLVAQAYIKTRIDSATFLGYISNGQPVLTDLLRIEGREVNVDITRVNFDSEELDAFLSSNVSVENGNFDDRDCYDILLRSEYGVFRARSLVKTRVYDKIGWFYDYLQTMGTSVFYKLYEVLDSPLSPLIKYVANLVDRNITVSTIDREMNASMEEVIVTMDNRFAPPLIVNITASENRKAFSKFAAQGLNGNVFQLNKYYVLSRSSASVFSIDPPKIVFANEYSDDFIRYKREEVELKTTNFARFPSDWSDEIYEAGVIRYDKMLDFEKKAKLLDFSIGEERYCEFNFYQPYHNNAEDNFFAQFAKLRLDIEPNILMKKKKTPRKK